MLKEQKLNALLEIGCEEIPARFMPGFLEDLGNKAREKLAQERVTFSKIETLGTSRRLTLFIEGIAVKQADLTEEIKGPSAEIAFDASGKPTQAAIGFSNSLKVPLEQLSVRTVGNRNYVFAKVLRKGEKTEIVLRQLFPAIITSLYQPVSMRWGTQDFKFIRPIHSLLALCGKKIAKFTLAGIASSNKNFGHRHNKQQTTNYKLQNADLSLYKKTLLKLGVIVDQNERKELIRSRVLAAAKKSKAEPQLDEALLSEVDFLVENPEVYVGKINPAFLAIPQVVLITSMQKNQKYFPLLDKKGKLLPKFAVVTDRCKNPAVVDGNEKILSARLADARFFYEEDKKIPLQLRVPDLEKVSFFEKLGNMRQKSERIEKLSAWIGKRLGLKDDEIKICQNIARLCKADLTSKMVFEFPQLQGLMGKEYALLSGENPLVAQGIFEHYLPRFAEDALPQSLPGTVVALADRLDSIVGAFLVGSVPTGSEDPYGLRRAVQGIIRLLIEKKLDLLLDEALEHAFKSFEADPAAFSKVKKESLVFFAARLKPLLLDKGVRYDIADAALSGFNDILDVVEKALSLNSLLAEKWLEGVVASADRLSRIAGSVSHSQVLEHDLVEEEEKTLYNLYLKVNWEVNEKIKAERWADAAKKLGRLTDPIENFFDKVLVMHENERLKTNRLALLKSLELLYFSVADFRKIVLEGGVKNEKV